MPRRMPAVFGLGLLILCFAASEWVAGQGGPAAPPPPRQEPRRSLENSNPPLFFRENWKLDPNAPNVNDEREPEQGMPRYQTKGIVEDRAREQPEDSDVACANCNQRRVPNQAVPGMARCGTNGIGGRTNRQRGPQPSDEPTATLAQDSNRDHEEQRDRAAP